jgi:hypothetical protein
MLVESGYTLIEVLDLARHTRAHLTARAIGTNATWNADGSRAVFRRFNVPFWVATDGSGETGTVPGGTFNDFPSSAGPNVDSILVVRIHPETSGDIFLMSINGIFEPRPLVVTPAYEGGPELSPDGRWLLYQSDASGQPEVYVRRYPNLDRQWQVSEGGGVQPRWSHNSREIYYRSGLGVVAVTLDASRGEPAFGKPATLFRGEYAFGGNVSIANYDVMPDGRFIMLRQSGSSVLGRVVTNWTNELNRILATGR